LGGLTGRRFSNTIVVSPLLSGLLRRLATAWAVAFLYAELQRLQD
jgi:hypothetical protein